MQVIRAAAVKRRRQKPASVLALDEMRDCFLLQTVSYLLFDVLCVSGNAHGKLLENFRLKVTLMAFGLQHAKQGPGKGDHYLDDV